MNRHQSLVEQFHAAFKAPIGLAPSVDVTPELKELRIELIREELKELQDALDACDVVETADALGDLLFVVYGAGVCFGIDLGPVFEEIAASNMSKLDTNGEPIFRFDGKVLKGPNYWKPNLASILAAQAEDALDLSAA